MQQGRESRASKSSSRRGDRKPGSVLANKMNYTLAESAYSRDDVPAHALEAKKRVQASIQPDVLGVAPPPWDSTTTTVVHPKQNRALQTQLSKFQPFRPVYNYRSEVLPRDTSVPIEEHTGIHSKFKMSESAVLDRRSQSRAVTAKELLRWESSVRRVEMEVHPALREKPQWNSSTEIRKNSPQKYKEPDLEEYRKKRDSGILMNRTQRTGKEYVTPEKVYEMTKEMQRKLKMDARVKSEEQGRQIRSPTPHDRLKILAEESELKQLADMRKGLFKSMAKTMTKSRKTKQFYHSGQYGIHPLLDPKERPCWSCCGASSESSQGCQFKLVDPDRWYLASA